MSNEREQIAQRQAKLDELVRLGVAPYPNHYDRTSSVSTIVAAHGGETGDALETAKPVVRTAGRILSIRGFGKANFLVISDGLARIQVYVRADSLSASTSRSTGCWTSAITSASKGASSGPRRTSSRSGRRR